MRHLSGVWGRSDSLWGAITTLIPSGHSHSEEAYLSFPARRHKAFGGGGFAILGVG